MLPWDLPIREHANNTCASVSAKVRSVLCIKLQQHFRKDRSTIRAHSHASLPSAIYQISYSSTPASTAALYSACASVAATRLPPDAAATAPSAQPSTHRSTTSCRGAARWHAAKAVLLSTTCAATSKPKQALCRKTKS